MYRDVPEDLVSLLSSEALWGDHPLGREIAGELETVSGLTADDLRGFSCPRLPSRNGGVDHCRGHRCGRDQDSGRGAVERLARGRFRSRPCPCSPRLAAHPRHRIHIRPSEQAHLQLAVPEASRAIPTVTPSTCSTPSSARA